MNQKELNNFFDFLLAAKRKTYAAGGQDTSVPTPLIAGSKQLEWHSGDWLYRDVYFGTTKFSGMETVYWQSKPIWSMGYFGGVRPESSAKLVEPLYTFLQKALGQANREHPYRGPESFTLEDWEYQSVLSGDENHFSGSEEIWQENQSLYFLNFAGGFVV